MIQVSWQMKHTQNLWPWLWPWTVTLTLKLCTWNMAAEWTFETDYPSRTLETNEWTLFCYGQLLTLSSDLDTEAVTLTLKQWLWHWIWNESSTHNLMQWTSDQCFINIPSRVLGDNYAATRILLPTEEQEDERMDGRMEGDHY